MTKWVLQVTDFDFPCFIHEDHEQWADSVDDAMVFDDRDSKEVKLMYWKAVLGLDFKVIEL